MAAAEGRTRSGTGTYPVRGIAHSFSPMPLNVPLWLGGATPGRQCAGMLGSPELGLRFGGLSQHPGVQRFLRH